ncbi:Glycosyl hydrolases family 2 [Alistipes timonensis JC136]|uniref:Glycosyl hydrolases family 2 n=1 Tax=Alistipes timonensis JC136 TaxID=1033731 RepID=A0A1H3ZGQ2_9BACT|nr:sugar-binding domain-containing protein [Alistipes timonensis]SEA22718.1 Glycosyl hydrolases family 2 [Alistipes timonensis JC136]
MNQTILTLLFAAGSILSAPAQAWQPAGDKIKTAWADKVDPACPLPEYPRPTLVRPAWQNLNGHWNYAIRPADAPQPELFDGKILVPYPVESSLSGVQRRLAENEVLWYERRFTVPAEWRQGALLLHFGAVDWEADVYLNGIRVGGHKGGYTAFSIDIAPYLTRGEQTLAVRVADPTDRGTQPRGKQVTEARTIWYTPVTGIWQTVWLEPVPESRIASLRTTPDIDTKSLTVEAAIVGARRGDIVEITLRDNGRTVAEARAAAGEPLRLTLPEMKLWTPDTPMLYDLETTLLRGGKSVDRVGSYAAMRKNSVVRGKEGFLRLALNDRECFQFGPLDQGWWPDGLYTAPTDEALAYDIIKTKDLGFNMIRKHVKVEPERWYWHCDRLGILVWQDMPNGGPSPEWQNNRYFDGTEAKRTAESEAQFRKEWKEIVDQLYNHPSVAMWVPFNEAWGQFRTEEIARWTKDYDPTRIVNAASGGNFYPDAGEVLDIHSYPHPRFFLFDIGRVNVIGEYGGIGLPLEGHLWQPDQNWGYVRFKNAGEVTDEYVRYAEMLERLIPTGCSGAVYTQTTDVEIEVNGLMTYDRKRMKVDERRLHEVNQRLCRSLGQ